MSDGRFVDGLLYSEQVKHLLAKADFDHDKKISLDEFQTYYSNIVKNGVEPEVLLLDISNAIKVLKAGNIQRSPVSRGKVFNYHFKKTILHL